MSLFGGKKKLKKDKDQAEINSLIKEQAASKNQRAKNKNNKAKFLVVKSK